ncbi:MAG: truB [Haloplasmataceae bacterium]|nr:truB [Haloplasmataceae bacterium]
MDGILLINKPKGMTSHDCVNKIRRIFNTKKVGHLGTLDPNVTGVLPICINNGTKVIQFIENESKEYIADISIGISTSTEDGDGEVVESDTSYKHITRDDLLSILNSFIGEYEQIPPMISAVKINGKKLYEYARQGKVVERPARKVIFHEIELLSSENEFSGETITFKIRVHCSKGTYIRTLAVDIGKKLGYPAHMSSLIRTKSGQFSLENCFSFTDVENGHFDFISIYDSLQQYQMIMVDESLKFKIKNGQKLENQYEFDNYLVFCDYKEVLAVYELDENHSNMIKPARVFSE